MSRDKKLTLQRETVRNLQADSLQEVQGGSTPSIFLSIVVTVSIAESVGYSIKKIVSQRPNPNQTVSCGFCISQDAGVSCTCGCKIGS